MLSVQSRKREGLAGNLPRDHVTFPIRHLYLSHKAGPSKLRAQCIGRK